MRKAFIMMLGILGGSSSSPLWAQSGAYAAFNYVIQAYNQGDLASAQKAFRENAAVYLMGEGASQPAPVQDLFAVWDRQKAEIPDGRISAKRVFETSEGVIVQYVFYGIPDKNQIKDSPAVRLGGREGIVFIRVEGDFIVLWRDYSNARLFWEIATTEVHPHGAVIPDWPAGPEVIAEGPNPDAQAVALKFYQAMNAYNYAALDEMVASDMTMENRGLGISDQGSESIAQRWRMNQRDFPQSKVVVEEVVTHGAYAILRLLHYTTFMSVHFCDVIYFEGGKIKRMEQYFNGNEVAPYVESIEGRRQGAQAP